MKVDALKALNSIGESTTNIPVFLDEGPGISLAQLNEDAIFYTHHFQTLTSPNIAIYDNNTCTTTAQVLGCLRAGKIPLLLPNQLQGTIDSVTSSYNATYSVDMYAPRIAIPGPARQEQERVELTEDMSIAFFTSGSTGIPMIIYKKLQQLLVEVEQLEQVFGQFLTPATVFASGASHQHIYGFLFKLLWPLVTNRRIICDCYKDLNTIARNIGLSDPVCWISSPAQLKRLKPYKEMKITLSGIFCSGGPLSFEQAHMVKGIVGTLPVEVYGSTESGGIAYRKQKSPEQLWKTFPNVTIKPSRDSLLELKSPQFGDNHWHKVNDKVKIHSAKTFNLLGRADRITKIEGIRVSLTEIEQRLKALSYCADVYALNLEGSWRQIIAVAVQLSPEGNRFISRKGRKAMIEQLSGALSDHIDAAVLPKRWRFLTDIPRNSQNKINTREIVDCFDSPAINKNPVYLAEYNQEQLNSYQLFVPRDLVYFHGHFAQYSVLPGIVQILWVKSLIRKNNSGIMFVSAEKIKFRKPVLPGYVLDLSITFEPQKDSFSFTYTTEKQPVSSGKLIYEFPSATKQ